MHTNFDFKNCLHDFFTNHGLVYLKCGTEWESMEYQEIGQLHELSRECFPTMVKIAGQEARTDLRHMKALGIKVILGPLIESEYALKKFVTTAQQEYGHDQALQLGINLETKQAHEQLNRILNNAYFNEIDFVVIGRLDLSQSLGFNTIDVPEVHKITHDFIKAVHSKGKKVSVGGFVNPISCGLIKDDLKADFFNTIHLVFDLQKVQDTYLTTQKAIEFEIELYRYWKAINSARSSFYDQRVDLSLKKLNPTA
ncbi:MAG: hypothetical protein ED557_14520 [Balneola sp.]|nr:MAG: hypothetical protein ED557_14520 [Balneola sp.]